MRLLVSLAATAVLLSACAQFPHTPSAPPQEAVPDPGPAAAPEPAAPPPPPEARTVEEFDTTTAEDRAAAASSSSTGTLLGTDIASLGDPARPGFWIETPLVSEPGRGRVVLAGSETGVEVDLLPGQGGSRLSLPALRVLNVALTDLPTVEIYAF